MLTARYTPRMPGSVRLTSSNNHSQTRRGTSVVALLISATLLLPYIVAVYLGDLKLTPIKILIVLLVVPATFRLISQSGSGQRRLMASDGFALASFLLMSIGPIVNSGSRDFVSSVSQALEFYGMYVIARAYLFEMVSVQALIRGLQVATTVVVLLGLLDILLQRYFTQDLVTSLFPAVPAMLDASDPSLNREVMGRASLRAAATFDHPILFGTLCVTVLPLFLYSPMSRTRRFFMIALCVTGSLIALSSAPLLALAVVLAVYAYDRIMHAYKWRWRVLLSFIGLSIVAFSLASDNPLSWLFRNLTFNPQTAYFRLLIWELGSVVVSNSSLARDRFQSDG